MKKLVIIGLLLLVGCGGDRMIPDGELTLIFRDIFVSNAYVRSGDFAGSGVEVLRPDTLDMYRPILERYGYTVEDLKASIAGFSRRKSMRVTDVINDAISLLESEERHLRYMVGVADSVDAKSQRLLQRMVFERGEIRARKLGDTARLTVDVAVLPGVYTVSYSYLIDSLDGHRSLRTTMRLLDEGEKGRADGSAAVTNWMTSRARKSYTARLEALAGDSVLRIVFGNYPRPARNFRNELVVLGVDLRVDSLRVYYSPPVEVARDSALRIMLGFNELYDEIRARGTAHSGPVGAAGAGVFAPRGSER